MDKDNVNDYPLTKDQLKILDAILNGKTNIDYSNLEVFDINLFKAIKRRILIQSSKYVDKIPYIIDNTNKLLPCNIKYLCELMKYNMYRNIIIKNWNMYIEDIDYSFMNKYINFIIENNEALAIKILEQNPYIIYNCTNYTKEFAKKSILFIPTIFKYMLKYQNDIDLARLAVNMDINNIIYVSKDILVYILESYN